MLRPSWQTSQRLFSSRVAGPKMSAAPIFFGPFEVTDQVFLRTPHSFALVNLKPLLPGHVLVCPRAAHRRLTDLSPPELADLFSAVQRVQRMLARRYFPDAEGEEAKTGEEERLLRGAFNIALQDGPEAGQTVPHVHVHVIPRVRGSSAKPADVPGDKLYDMMAGEEGNVGGALWDAVRGNGEGGRNLDGSMGGRPTPGGKFPLIEDCDRAARSKEEMEAEAAEFRGVLEGMEKEEGR